MVIGRQLVALLLYRQVMCGEWCHTGEKETQLPAGRRQNRNRSFLPSPPVPLPPLLSSPLSLCERRERRVRGDERRDEETM